MILGLLFGCLRLYGVSILLLLLDILPEAGWVVLGIHLRMMILSLGFLIVGVGVGG